MIRATAVRKHKIDGEMPNGCCGGSCWRDGPR